MNSQSGQDNLAVRQHERHRCDLRARVQVGGESIGRVVLAVDGGSGQVGSDVAVHVTDCSRGGLGIKSNVFFPKQCVLTVRVEPEGGAGEAIETTVSVQRVAMLDKSPTYYLGTATVSDVKGSTDGQAEIVGLAMASEARAARGHGVTGGHGGAGGGAGHA
jgi:hypothetical protein